MERRASSAYAAELAGTFLLVLFVALVLAVYSAVGLGSTDMAFALAWAFMGTAVNPTSDKAWAPVVIGATYGLAVMVLGPMTGAALNPARAFGPALVSGEFGDAVTFLLAYVLGPVAGALAAVMAYGAIVLRGRPSPRPVDKLGSAEP